MNKREIENLLKMTIEEAFEKNQRLVHYIINKYSNYRFLLEVSINNYIAIKLYENMNFKIINIRKKYYNDIDAYVMERN